MRVLIDLTPVEVSKAIKDWVRKEKGKEVDEVILHFRTSIETECQFTGATVIKEVV